MIFSSFQRHMQVHAKMAGTGGEDLPLYRLPKLDLAARLPQKR